MSRSNKARHGTRTKYWKDTVQESASQARSRTKWRKVTKHSPKKTERSRKPQRPDVSHVDLTDDP